MNRMFFTPGRIAPVSALTLLLFSPFAQPQTSQQLAPRVDGIRFWSFGDVTRIAIETTGNYQLYSERIEKPNRVFFDLTGLAPPSAAQHGMQTIPVNDHRIRQIRVARVSENKTRVVFDLDSQVEVLSSQLVNPDRLMIEIRPKGTSIPALSASHSVIGSQKVDLATHGTSVDNDIAESEPVSAKVASASTVSASTIPAKTVSKVSPPPVLKRPIQDDPTDAYHPSRATTAAAVPPPVPAVVLPPAAIATSTTTGSSTVTPNEVEVAAASDNVGDRSLVRLLGLKLGRVVIDAGHGGHDSGTIGSNGLMEKELVLDIALRLGSLIKKQMGAEVIYTRSTDVFIPLEQRTRIANEKKADLFISVHANSSSEPSATGVETYYFNLTSDKNGLDLATRENATADSSISDLNDILHRAVLQTKKEESREFAQRVQASLTAVSQKSGTRPVDRGVRQAPFVVLIGATMPSILAEIGFVSNPRDEKQLRKSEQRQKIADALFRGVVQYNNSLSHVQIARAHTD